jgi:citrate lyase subunit beta / citryl-CoA lyase
MTVSDRPVWRSILYVPAHVDRFVAKAHLRGADAVQLDLEDSVPESEKDNARRRVPEAARQASRGQADVLVRVNRPWRHAFRDIEASVCPEVCAVGTPKVDSADHIRVIDELLSDIETDRGLTLGHTRIVAMIETPRGFLRAERIARASPRVVALDLGTEDFSLSLGVEPDPDIMAYPKQHLVIAAHAAGVMPVGLVGSLADFDDLDAFRRIARYSRRLGCEGASAIHPAQVPILNEEFSPPTSEVEYAQRVIDAYDRAEAEGLGATHVDGHMVDAPVVARARQLLERHNRISQRKA